MFLYTLASLAIFFFICLSRIHIFLLAALHLFFLSDTSGRMRRLHSSAATRIRDQKRGSQPHNKKTVHAASSGEPVTKSNPGRNRRALNLVFGRKRGQKQRLRPYFSSRRRFCDQNQTLETYLPPETNEFGGTYVSRVCF